MWVARNKNGVLNLYNEKPVKGKGVVWLCRDSYDSPHEKPLDNNLFRDVKWEDDEPTQVYLQVVYSKEQKEKIDKAFFELKRKIDKTR